VVLCFDPLAAKMLQSFFALALLRCSLAHYSGWANVRGANYVPSYAKRDVHDMFVPGIWDAEVVDREIGYAKNVNLNSLRVFVTYGGYNDGGQQDVFLQNYVDFQHMAKKHGLTLMITMAGHSGDCGNATAFINTVVAKEVKGVVIGYEADNEPPGGRFDYVNGCLVPALMAANKNPEVDVSVGWAHVGQAAHMYTNTSSINWHSYNGVDNGQAFKGEVKWLEGIMQKEGKPIVLTEWFGRPDMPLAGSYPIIRDHKVPAYLWALLIVPCNQHWDRPVARGDPPFQGLLWPNGTAYDELEEIECLRHECRTLTYVHYSHNRDDFKDAVHSFSDGDWVEDIKGQAVFNHGIGPRMASMMTANRTGASVTISLLNDTKRVAIYLPADTNGAEYTVKLDGKQIYQGTTIGDRLWENRVVLPVSNPQNDSKLEVVVGQGGPGNWRFMISGATFFSEDGPTPTPSPTPPWHQCGIATPPPHRLSHPLCR